MNDNSFKILASLDIQKSTKLISADIDKLETAIQNQKTLNITAGLNIDKSLQNIQSQLKSLVSQSNMPTIKVGIDVGDINATKNIAVGLKDIQTQAKQASENINKAVNSLTNLSSKYTNPITPIDVGGIIDAEKTIEKVQRRFQELGKVSIKGVYSDNNAVDSLDKMIVSIKNGQNEARTLTFELDKMGRAFYLTGGTSDNSGIQKQVQNINKAFTDYTQKLAQFKSTNHEILSGLVQPLSDFETKLNGLKTGTSSIDEVATAFKSLQTSASNITQNFSRQLSPIDSAIRNIAKGEETIAGLQAEFRGLANSPKEINTELTECVSLLNNVKKIESEQGRTDNWSKAYREWIDVVDQLQAKLKALRKEQNNSAPSYNMEIGRQITSLTNLSNNATFRNNSANTDVQVQREKIQALITEYQNLRTQLQGNISPEGLKQISTTLTTLKSQFEVVQNECNELKTSLNTTKALNKFGQDVELLRNRIISLREANSKSVKQFGQDYDKLLADADGLRIDFDNGNVNTDGLNTANRELRILEGNIKNANKTGHTLFQTIGEQAKKFASWMSLTTIIAGAARNIRDMITEVVELDSAMTNLKKVTDETNVGYDRFLDNAIKKAKELKIGLADLVNQTAEWAKKGYSVEEASILSTSSGMYSVVGEVDNTTAVQDLTTVMKSYNMAVEESIDIVDKFNNISNKYSVNASDIGTMLSNSISSLSIAGNSLDQAIAMGTTITEITGDSAEAGNTLKVLSMRLRGASTEIEAIGESTEGMATSTSKLQTQIKALTNVDGKGGFDIMADSENFKSTYDIMQGIANVWQDMSNVNQAALLEIIAGKQRGNTVSALLTNMAQANNILADSINSNNSAMEEYQLYLDSGKGKIQGFKTEFEVLARTIVDSEFLKGAIDTGTAFLSVLELLIDKFGLLSITLTSVGTIAAFKGKGLPSLISQLHSAGTSVKEIVQTLSLAKNIKGTYKDFGIDLTVLDTNDIKSLQSYIDLLDSGKATSEELAKTMEYASDSAKIQAQSFEKLNEAKRNGKVSAQDYTVATKSLATAQKVTTATSKALSVALNLVANVGLTLAITGITKLLDALIVTEEEALEKREKNIQKIQESVQKYQDEEQAINSLFDRYTELYNSTDDLATVKQDLSQIQNELIDKFGEEAEAVDLLNGKYSENLKIQRELRKQEAEDFLFDNAAAIETAEKRTSGRLSQTTSYFTPVFEKMSDSDFKKIEEALAGYGQFDRMYSNIFDDKGTIAGFTMGDWHTTEEQIEGLERVITAYKKTANYSQEVYEDLVALKNNLDKQALSDKELIENAKHYQSIIDATPTAEYDRAIDELKAKQKELSSLKANNSSLFDIQTAEQELIDIQNTALKYAGSSSVLKQEVFDIINSVDFVTKDLSSSFEALKTDIKEFAGEDFENSLSQIDKIKSAMQTLASGEMLEWDDASELMFDIDTERVLGDFEEIDGKYRLIGNDITSLITLKDQLIKKQIEEIESEKEKQKTALETKRIELETARQKLSRSNSASDAKYWNNQISDIENEMVRINALTRDYNYLIQHLNSQLGNTVDLASALEERMKKAQEHADKYADAMTKQVDNIIDNYQDELDTLEEQKSALEEQLDVLEEQKSEIEDIIDRHKDLVDVIGDEIDKEIELLEKQREAEEDAIQAKIDALKESKEKQEEENDLIEKELELQKKLADLEKAKQTKVRTYSESRGWHYDVDKEAVANAQTAVADAQKTYDDAVAEKVFDDQIEALEKQKEAVGESYEEQLKAYEDYYEQWKSVLDEEIKAENERLAVEIMGSDWREKIKKKDINILNLFAGNFRSYNGQLKNLVNNEISSLKESILAKEDEIKAKQKQIKVWQDYKKQVEDSINSVKNKYDDYINYLNGVTLNENSTYEDRQNALSNFIDYYASCIDEIQNLQNDLSGLSTTIDVYVDTSMARYEMADFMEMYKDGVMGMHKMLQASSGGYGVVNSAWDEKLAKAAMEVEKWGGDIDSLIEHLRGYSTGGVNDNTGIVKLHGEKQRVETVFNAQQGRYLYDMVKTGNFSQLVAQKAIDGLKTALKPNQISNSTNDSRVINIQNMTIKSDNPTQFHDQFMKEIGQYWRVQLAESKVK